MTTLTPERLSDIEALIGWDIPTAHEIRALVAAAKALTEIASYQGDDDALDMTAREMRAIARAALASAKAAK